MTTYGISALRLDAQGNVVLATVRQWDPAHARWIGRRADRTLPELLALLDRGDTLRAIFRVDRATVPGPAFQRSADGRTLTLPAQGDLTLQRLAVSWL